MDARQSFLMTFRQLASSSKTKCVFPNLPSSTSPFGWHPFFRDSGLRVRHLVLAETYRVAF